MDNQALLITVLSISIFTFIVTIVDLVYFSKFLHITPSKESTTPTGSTTKEILPSTLISPEAAAGAVAINAILLVVAIIAFAWSIYGLVVVKKGIRAYARPYPATVYSYKGK